MPTELNVELQMAADTDVRQHIHSHPGADTWAVITLDSIDIMTRDGFDDAFADLHRLQAVVADAISGLRELQVHKQE